MGLQNIMIIHYFERLRVPTSFPIRMRVAVDVTTSPCSRETRRATYAKLARDFVKSRAIVRQNIIVHDNTYWRCSQASSKLRTFNLKFWTASPVNGQRTLSKIIILRASPACSTFFRPSHCLGTSGQNATVLNKEKRRESQASPGNLRSERKDKLTCYLAC